MCNKKLKMSEFLIYLKVPVYVAEWAIHSLGIDNDAPEGSVKRAIIDFPKDSVENRLIKKFLEKTPAGVSPDMKGEHNLGVRIPSYKLKDPRVYNYLNEASKKLLTDSLETLLLQNLWSELGSLENLNCSIKQTIVSWCKMHGISDQYEDTIAQKFYRLRKRYAKKGIFLDKNRNDFDDSSETK